MNIAVSSANLTFFGLICTIRGRRAEFVASINDCHNHKIFVSINYTCY